MMQLRILCTALALCGLSISSYANTPKQAFTTLNECVRSGKSAHCSDNITASSSDLYQRFSSYGLMECLPKDVTYVSQTKEGNFTMIRASTRTLGDQPKFMRFYFAEEEGQWKLDIPQSLRVSLGQNWQQQVNMTEQLYLALKGQLGDNVGCNAVRGIAQKQQQAKQ